jgi:phage regulatory protein, rha family|nr:MAG TPA: regulatory protein [Caudoviricetes sp.]
MKKSEIKKMATLDSREVAKMIGKEHKHLLRDITRYSNYFIETKIGLNDFFQENQYVDTIGRKLKCYKITRKGCEFLAHKLTGRKGSIFTALYINRFHEMEKELNRNNNGNAILIPADKVKYWNILKNLDEPIAEGIRDLFTQHKKMKEAIEEIDKIKAQLIGIGGTHRFLIKKFEGK